MYIFDFFSIKRKLKKNCLENVFIESRKLKKIYISDMLQPTSSSSYLHQSSSSMAATGHQQSSSQPMPVQSTYSHQQVIRDSYIISFSKPYHTRELFSVMPWPIIWDLLTKRTDFLLSATSPGFYLIMYLWNNSESKRTITSY